MVTGSECPIGSGVLGGDEDSNVDEACTDPEGSPSAHVVSEIDIHVNNLNVQWQYFHSEHFCKQIP